MGKQAGQDQPLGQVTLSLPDPGEPPAWRRHRLPGEGVRAALGSADSGSPQFQGEWFVVGLAGSTHRKTDSSLLSPFTATFEKNENGSLKVSYAMTRGHRCITWSYVLIAAAQPGGFSVDNTAAPGKGPEEVQVHDTDYSVFALMLSRRRSGGQSVLTVSLLCRTWVIRTRVLEKFVHLVRAQGLSDNNVVFPDLAGPGLSGWGGSPDPA
ncbi:epididymal-specific lipocalin-12 [Prionailurus bengalensis]|uniref:epididymal-specific lipocalin-12 n=1 Tax=Prionailurus bengalensis TaxID=37029 RepID=UPI001CA80A16|nr:epididymal-specific lipocalin-12 [Prionailurus bengalensis]